MTVQYIALILLALRVVSLGLVISVLYRQIRLLHVSSSHKIAGLRARMLTLGVIFLLGHLLPIATDVYYGIIDPSDGDINLLVWYAISNSVAGLAASMLLWRIYHESGQQSEVQQTKSINIDELMNK